MSHMSIDSYCSWKQSCFAPSRLNFQEAKLEPFEAKWNMVKETTYLWFSSHIRLGLDPEWREGGRQQIQLPFCTFDPMKRR